MYAAAQPSSSERSCPDGLPRRRCRPLFVESLAAIPMNVFRQLKS